MAKPWILDELAAAWWVKIILDAVDKYGTLRIRPILASRCPTWRRVHAILGLLLMPTNKYGLREWAIRPGLESRLRDAGFDHVTRELLDTRKYEAACRHIDQQVPQEGAEASEADGGCNRRSPCNHEATTAETDQ